MKDKSVEYDANLLSKGDFTKLLFDQPPLIKPRMDEFEVFERLGVTEIQNFGVRTRISLRMGIEGRVQLILWGSGMYIREAALNLMEKLYSSGVLEKASSDNDSS